MTNQIEWMRKQLEDEHKDVTSKAQLLQQITAIDKKLQEVEYKLITRADALSDDKYFQTAYNLYQNFIWLGGEIGTGAGDVQGTGDWGITETAMSLVLDLERQLTAVQAEYKGVMDKEVPAYNQSITGSGLKPLQTTGAPPPPARTGGRFGGGN
jgi:hypothetical protein